MTDTLILIIFQSSRTTFALKHLNFVRQRGGVGYYTPLFKAALTPPAGSASDLSGSTFPGASLSHACR